ncbi:unnamed protein product [marine sediment metagenome]|uniref:Electron transfer flavoprotein alpha/beta-subunit N-terminal domain-containing protein n=1 Tax=marine sediment metagenome TaxID=412755 RepID=X1SNM0_9ZZZZ
MLKFLYMFMNPNLDSTKHRAVIDASPTTKAFIIGVNSMEEGAKIAKQLIEQEGVELVELCAAFGYNGAQKVHDEVGDKVPVGLITHQVWNAVKLAKFLPGG